MQLLEIALASIIAGALDTVAGFGGVLLLLPILVLVAGPEQAVLLTAIIPFGWNGARTFVLREFVDVKAAGLFFLGILPGTLIGGRLLDVVDPAALRLAIGLILILYGIYYVVRLYVELPEVRGIKRWAFPIFGLLSGAVGALLGAGNGPLQTMALTGADMPARVVSAMTGVLGVLTGLSRLGSYAANGLLTVDLLVPGGIGLVAGAMGALLGVRIARRAKDSTLELLIGGALLLAGVRLLF